jgi:hypothetical protein
MPSFISKQVSMTFVTDFKSTPLYRWHEHALPIIMDEMTNPWK